MNKVYYTYHIRIANDNYVYVEKRNPQGQRMGESRGNFGYKDQSRAQIDALKEAAQNKTLQGSQKVKELGEALFNALFDNRLCDDFFNFYRQVVRVEKKLLRIELDMDEEIMHEVVALPWEFMRLPTEANLGTLWLATAPKLILSRRRARRYEPSPIQLAENEKLRIVLAVAVPEELKAVKYEEVWADLKKLAAEQTHRIELLPLVNPGTTETIDAILSEKPHIFHFIGHGRLHDEDGKEVGQIALLDEWDEVDWVDAEYFSDLLNEHQPSVVVLQACEGGALSASEPFVGLASRVVNQNIPIVVAMQYEVSNSTATDFARRFYKKLAQGDPVDRAVQNARRGIALGPTRYKERDFATPVLFMGVQDGHLFKPKQSTGSSTVATAEQRSKPKKIIQMNRKPKSELVNALLACPTMDDRASRDIVVDELRDEIRHNIKRHSGARVDVMGIVSTCFNYAGGIKELIEIVRDYEGPSIPMQKVDELMRKEGLGT